MYLEECKKERLPILKQSTYAAAMQIAKTNKASHPATNVIVKKIYPIR
jgi:hypothetical protein